MSSLEKAKLMEVTADEQATEVSGTSVDVQFNPQSLKLTFQNALGTEVTKGAQDRQYLGKISATLAFDLQFDTSDEGTTDAPVSVRTRTGAVERFLQPKGEDKKKQRPPKARFVWHDLVFDGMIENLTVDIDLFASNGTPLRAKMSVSIREQDAKYMAGQAGAGANSGSGARAPGKGGSGPGSVGATIGASVGVSLGAGASIGLSAGVTDSTSLALTGESAAEFATRAGLDPAAWRGVATGSGSTLSLAGGAEIDFNASASVSAGVGVTVGVEAGSAVSLEGAFGLDSRATPPTPAGLALGGGSASAGFALSSAGGVSAAVETVSILRAGAAAASTKAAFGTAVGSPIAAAALGTTNGTATAGGGAPDGAPTRVSPAPPEQPRAPLVRTGLPSITSQSTAAPAPAPPVADPRATSFGFGVPLRPRVGGAAEARRGALGGQIPLRPGDQGSDSIETAPEPGAAPWTYLPRDKARPVADAAQRARRPIRPCGCLGPCGHGGGR